ncbi:MAG: hypothetical protein AAGB01_03440, partial [Cyanobacteria bacterium P01_F01_bin.42]
AVMLSPEELIGQKVWVEIPRDPDFPDLEPIRIKAIITQPTSPPWFYARFDSPPPTIRESGKWISPLEAQQAYLYSPVLEEVEYEDESREDFDLEDEFNIF